MLCCPVEWYSIQTTLIFCFSLQIRASIRQTGPTARRVSLLCRLEPTTAACVRFAYCDRTITATSPAAALAFTPSPTSSSCASGYSPVSSPPSTGSCLMLRVSLSTHGVMCRSPPCGNRWQVSSRGLTFSSWPASTPHWWIYWWSASTCSWSRTQRSPTKPSTRVWGALRSTLTITGAVMSTMSMAATCGFAGSYHSTVPLRQTAIPGMYPGITADARHWRSRLIFYLLCHFVTRFLHTILCVCDLL